MNSGAQQIGESAGAVWHALNENGSLSLAEFRKVTELLKVKNAAR